ncbi:MAG: hypothetical protein R3344_02880 [Acidobacteriota bacterium]|nr:hypothetical protein [Acidobacteriota bacterium]
MNRTATLALASLVLLGVTMAPWGEPRARETLLPAVGFVPDASAAPGAEVHDTIWFVDQPSYRARLVMINDEQRQEYLRNRVRATTDPFAAAQTSKGFLTFVLELESKVEEELVFQPQQCRLMTNRKEIRLPLDIPTIEAAYAAAQQEVPPAYEKARRALYDGEALLVPDDMLTGLLIYRGLDPKTKSFVMEIHVTTTEGEVEQFSVRYLREKRKKKD